MSAFFTKVQNHKISLALFFPVWYNVRNQWIWRQIMPNTAAQFYFYAYYFFTDRK